MKYPFSAKDFVQLPPGIDPEQFVLSTNGPRRNLNREQKKELVVTLLKRKPNESTEKSGGWPALITKPSPRSARP